MSTGNKEIINAIKILKPQFSTPQRSMVFYWTNKDTLPVDGNVYMLGNMESVATAIYQMCNAIDSKVVEVSYGGSLCEDIIKTIQMNAAKFVKDKPHYVQKINEIEQMIKNDKSRLLYTQPMNAKSAVQYVKSTTTPGSNNDGLVMSFIDEDGAAVSFARSDGSVDSRLEYLANALYTLCKCFIFKYTFGLEEDVYMFCNMLLTLINRCDVNKEDKQPGKDTVLSAQIEEDLSDNCLQISLDDLRKMGFTDEQIFNSTQDNPLQLTNDKLEKIGITPEKFKEMLDQIKPVSSSTDPHLQ